nr:hypothetical protein [uncultured Hyphomonas sp.]
MSAMQTRTQVRTETRTMTRLQLTLDTAERFVELAKGHGLTSGVWWSRRLELMIRNEYVRWIKIALFKKGDPVGGVYLRFDWQKQRAICLSYGDDVDLSDIPDGDTFSSIQRSLDAIDRYVGRMMAEGDADDGEVWFQYDFDAIGKWGRSEIERVCDIQRTPEERERHRAEWERIEKAQASARRTSISPSDLPETSFEAWGKA